MPAPTRRPVPSRAVALQLACLLGLVTAACEAWPDPAPPPALRVLHLLHPPQPLVHPLRIQVEVEDPAGGRIVATGEIQMGGTIRALTRSLWESLRANGCTVDRADAPNGESGDPFERAMRQLVVLPEGWRFVSAQDLPVGTPSRRTPELRLELTP